MKHSSANKEHSFIASTAWALVVLVGMVALGLLMALPLPWKQQGILGIALVAGAIVVSLISRRRLVTLILIVVSVFSTLRYGYWRVTQTWDGVTSAGHLRQWDTLIVLLLVFAELYAFVTLLMGYFQTLRPLRRPPLPLIGRPQNWSTVDVLIPTYNEPLSIVRATVLGALALDYPNDKFKVVVLDDGRRPEFAEFARQVGVGYVMRDNNAHAKAGNINHALSMTNGEYVAIFDSDHIPTSSFLQATLGWFQRDPRLGMVQTPHHFYSPDPFERNLSQFRRIPNEGELFHRLVQDGNDLWNASFFCGSCAVLRRQALQEIGGIAVETVTEDAHTALRMQKRRWNTAYVNLPQAAGLATESLPAHIGQRIRWARGMVQILRTENPLFARGLTWSQRLCYFNATTHFLFALPRLTFLLIPLVYLLLGMVNIYGYSLSVLTYAFPHILLASITNSRIQGRYRFSFWNEIYEAVLAPYILFPTLLALINPRLGKFNVTSKGGKIRRSYFNRRIALPFLFLLALNVIGLVAAERRFVTDVSHRDTVLMNAVWAAYNCVILAVAASVAWEKKQRRSDVRVDVRLPLRILTQDGQSVAGVSAQLSGHGTMARVSRSVRLRRGAAVLVSLGGEPSPCNIRARVAHTRKGHLHLFFPELSLAQEQYLVQQIYSKPEAWITWNKSRPVDQPFRSLAQIIWLAMRGAFLVVLGFIFSRAPREERQAPQLQRERRREPAVLVAVTLAAVLGLCPLPTLASEPVTDQHSSEVLPTREIETSAPRFHDQYDLGTLGGHRALAFAKSGASQNFFLDMPLTKIITAATLRLHYTAQSLRPGEAWIELWMNGTRVNSLPLAPGEQQTEVALPTDLLITENTLTIQLQGTCAACRKTSAAWVTVDPASELALTGTRLPLANDLSLLPMPFFDSASQRSWTLPFVFSDRPNMEVLKAAAMVASWFGVFSDYRGVRFPVTIGDLPEGHAVVFAFHDSTLGSALGLPEKHGALIAMRDNPRDPYGKLLILAGDHPADLLAAAQTLVTRNHAQAHTDTVAAKSLNLPPRREYTAPRWLNARKPAAVGVYTTPERLKLQGSGSIDLYFRLPPDLFLQARASVPLLLKYSYAGVRENSHAALHIRLNDRDVESVRLQPAASATQAEDTINLPTDRLRPYTNLLTVDFDFGRESLPGSETQVASVQQDSSIDLRGLPHSAVLPRLELFADSGFPFTAWPDLGRAAVVLSDTPDNKEYETLLSLVGFFGAQTGVPATHLSVTDASHFQNVRDKDLIVLGAPASQPLLSEWASNMPLDLAAGAKLNRNPAPSRLLHPEWSFRSADRERLATLISSATPLDVIVQCFVSPIHTNRSVMTIVPGDSGYLDAISAMVTPVLEKGPIYGAVSIAENGRFQSFLVSTSAYRFGNADPFEQAKIFLLEHYLLLPLLLLLLALAIAGWMHRSTEQVAARRLMLGRS